MGARTATPAVAPDAAAAHTDTVTITMTRAQLDALLEGHYEQESKRCLDQIDGWRHDTSPRAPGERQRTIDFWTRRLRALVALRTAQGKPLD